MTKDEVGFLIKGMVLASYHNQVLSALSTKAFEDLMVWMKYSLQIQIISELCLKNLIKICTLLKLSKKSEHSIYGMKRLNILSIILKV